MDTSYKNICLDPGLSQIYTTSQARIIHEAMEAVASGPRFLPALKTGIIDRPELWEIFYGLLETIYIYIISRNKDIIHIIVIICAK